MICSRHFILSANFNSISEEKIIDLTAEALVDGKAVGWFQGRMEFGPRALGQRSILANPFFEDTRDKINLQIKKRPWYQPLCPSILEEDREKI